MFSKFEIQGFYILYKTRRTNFDRNSVGSVDGVDIQGRNQSELVIYENNCCYAMAVFGLELSLSVRNILFDENTSGVRASIQTQLSGGTNFLEIAQTETSMKCSNITFQHRCSLNYRFDQLQKLKIVVYGVQEDSNLFNCRFGEVIFEMATVLSKGGTLSLPLSQFSFVDVRISVPDFYGQYLKLRFSGSHIHGPENFPVAVYFILLLKTENRTIMLFKSEVWKDSKHPEWKEFSIPLFVMQFYQQGCLQIHCYNQNFNTEDTLIGFCTTSIAQLHRGVGALNSYMLMNFNGKRIHEKTRIDLQMIELTHGETFFQTIKEGTHLHVTTAIDMTASNGNLLRPDSLHYIHPHVPSPYVQALTNLIPPLLPYFAQPRIGALGFGAKIEPNFEFSQCFYLNGSRTDQHVNGLSGLIDAYRSSLFSIQPFAPTDFSEVIYHVSKFAKAESRRFLGLYFVLFILTDGGLSNTRRTIDAIVDCSPHPISIIAIGIGSNRDFTAIKSLESPVLKHSDGRVLARHIFQFISYPDLKNDDAIALIPLQVSQWKHMISMSKSG